MTSSSPLKGVIDKVFRPSSVEEMEMLEGIK